MEFRSIFLFNLEKSSYLKEMNKNFTSRVIAYADSRGLSDAPTSTGIGGLSIVRARAPSELMNTLYSPLLCFVLQGKKETAFGDKTVTFGANDTLIVSTHIPTVSQVTAASPLVPYVSLAIEIDLGIIRALQAELELDGSTSSETASIVSGASGDELANALQRLFDLHDRPSAEQRIVAPLLVREIHFRMLFERHSGMLRRLARPDSHESRINRAILKLQKDYAQPIAVQELAARAGMSPSSFHEHFKAVTAKTPLQFLKDLRLLIAQQKLSSSTMQVSAVAFDVGYESVTQFSREYARKFGHPPSHEKRQAA